MDNLLSDFNTAGGGDETLENTGAFDKPPDFRRRKVKAMPSKDIDRAESSTDSVVRIASTEATEEQEERRESFVSVLTQVVVPLMISGSATVCTGVYLKQIQSWDVFKTVKEAIILIPALLGLKGNLEMTLASRLCTEANLGNMKDQKQQNLMLFGNMALLQCQGTVAALFASVVAVILVILRYNEFDLCHTLLLSACSIATAAIASFVLGLVTFGIIVLSMRYNVNPDNVTTPIAASLGDFISLLLFSFITYGMHSVLSSTPWLPLTIIISFLLLIPLWIRIAGRNKYTKQVLISGWFPILSAMLISTVGGLVLEHFIKENEYVSAFQPVINGIGGNLVSVQASRISTSLHQLYTLGKLPSHVPILINPIMVMFSQHKTAHSLTCRVLMSLVIPCHLILAELTSCIANNNCFPDVSFLLLYLIACVTQVAILMYSAYVISHYAWKIGSNPDQSAIPFLTALGDLLGIVFMGCVCIALKALEEESEYATK